MEIVTPFSNSPSTPEIERELDAGERILWSGRPDPALWKRRAFRQWPFAFLISAFMTMWMSGASREAFHQWQSEKSLDWTLVLFPMSGLLFGLLMLIPAGAMWLAPWLEAARARRTFYALTDRRAILVTAGSKRRVQSVDGAQMQLERRDQTDSTGDLILMKTVKGSGEDEKTVETGFFGIPNPREVERMVRAHFQNQGSL